MSTLKVPEYVKDREVYEEEGILYTDFTDGAGTSGTYTSKMVLPAGFFIERCWLTDVTGFTNDTTAVVIVGYNGNTDGLMTGTPSVFTTASYIDLGAPSGTQLVSTAFSPIITVTGGGDFTSINAGAMTIKVMGFMM